MPATAKNKDRFKSLWRPAIGWMCVLGLANTFLVVPFVASAKPVDTAALVSLVTIILGLGGARTIEKLKKVPDPAAAAEDDEK